MDGNNNSFLSSYKSKSDARMEATTPAQEQPAPAERLNAARTAVAEPPAPAQQSASEERPAPLRYEQRSGFRPVRTGGGTPPPRGRRSPVLPIALAALVVIGLVAGLIWYFNRGVTVIDFMDWTQNDVRLWATDNGVNLQIEEHFNDEYEAGRVYQQSPAAGTTVAKGGFVQVAISKGHDLTVTLPLPDLMSMTKTEVEQWAAQNFMAKVRITAEFSDTVESGRVIRFEINDNTVVDNITRNTPVYVIVSKGKEDETAVQVTVPNFREKTIADCYTFANDNGIVLKVTEQYDDYAPKGSILSQSVKADEKVSKGDTIELVVSMGKKITVPSFAGFSKQQATAVAGDLGIPVSIVEEYSSRPLGEFISQSLEEGTVYSGGDVLEISYSLGNKVVISDFTGQTRDAIETWAKGLNDQGANIRLSVTYTQSNQPKGRILYQSKANTTIGISTTIRITVSTGRAVFVPDFVAPAGSEYQDIITREKAMEMCESLGLVPVFVEAKSSGRLPGEVWSQSVAAGAEVSEGATITLKYVPANVRVSVPNFVGMTEAQIRSAGYTKQFIITFVIGDKYNPGTADKVTKQSLTQGTRVAAGTAITLTVGPADPPETEEPTPEPSVSPTEEPTQSPKPSAT